MSAREFFDQWLFNAGMNLVAVEDVGGGSFRVVVGVLGTTGIVASVRCKARGGSPDWYTVMEGLRVIGKALSRAAA